MTITLGNSKKFELSKKNPSNSFTYRIIIPGIIGLQVIFNKLNFVNDSKFLTNNSYNNQIVKKIKNFKYSTLFK